MTKTIIELNDLDIPVLVEAIDTKYHEYYRAQAAAAAEGEWASEAHQALDSLENIREALSESGHVDPERTEDIE